MSASIPKAVLYYNPKNVWSAATLLALQEKGYSDDEVDLRIVDTDKGENLALSFLRLNPKGTLPTLVVPLAKTLSPDDDHLFKAVTDTKTIIEFLDKSRSAVSRTHTVSSAPAPALAPATIAQSATANALIQLLHSDAADPQSHFYYSAATPAELRTASSTILSFFIERRKVLNAYIHEASGGASGGVNGHVQKQPQHGPSDKTRKLWNEKLAHAEELYAVLSVADKDEAALTPEQKSARSKYFQLAAEYRQVNLRTILTTLDKEMTGPLSLGDQISLADLHLAPWLARIAFLCGCGASDSGDTVISKLEARIGDGFVFPKEFQSMVAPDLKKDPTLATTPGAKHAKLAAFWDEMIARPSWKKVYGAGLF